MGMDEYPGHGERVRHAAGVLAAGAAEAAQRVSGDVVAALDRYFLDGVRHVVDGDGQIPLGDLFRGPRVARRAPDLVGEGQEFPAHDFLVDRGVAVRPEHLRKESRVELADHDVAVGDGQRPVVPIAGGARVGSRRVGSDPIPGAVEMEDGAAAGGDGVDVHHGGPHPDAGDLRLEGAFEGAVVARDVRRRASHVEADDALESRHERRPRARHDAAGRSRENRVLAPERPGVGEAAVGLHEHEAGPAVRVPEDVRRHAVDVAPEDGRKVRVDHGGVAPRHQLHQGADLVAERNLGEADVARDVADGALVVGMAVAVDQRHRDGTEAGGERAFEVPPRRVAVQRDEDVAARTDSFARLDDPVEQHVRQVDA